jgi:hypothetical protein
MTAFISITHDPQAIQLGCEAPRPQWCDGRCNGCALDQRLAEEENRRQQADDCFDAPLSMLNGED